MSNTAVIRAKKESSFSMTAREPIVIASDDSDDETPFSTPTASPGVSQR